ncbi:MAG: GNAT family N-acetyltransferase [Fimbriimonadales bacterium]|nr:GNAT family N-acetyltransferase [Fimbriimonadales bacterium]
MPVRRCLRDGLPAGAAVVFFASGSLLGSRLRHRGWHLHLRWVDVAIDARRGAESVIRDASRNVRRSLEALRTEGWTTGLSQKPEDLERFEKEMYRPTLDARHGAQATRFDPAALRRMFREGFLIQAFRGGEWLAADLAVACSDELWLAVFGVLGGDESVRRSSVATLLTERALREAERRGVPRVNHGGSLGFANDGTLLYKARWGGVPEARSYAKRGGRLYARDWFDVALWVDPSLPQALAAIDRALPLVDEGPRIAGLSGTVPRPSAFDRLADRFGWTVLASA